MIVIRQMVRRSNQRFLNHRKEATQAAQTFCNTLENAKKYIAKAERPVCEIIRVLFPEQKAAVIQFRKCLKGRKLRSLDAAWKKYEDFRTQHHHEDPIPHLASANTEFEAIYRKEMRSHIESLLKFTKI